MKKLPAWMNRFVLSFILSGFMTAVVAGVSTIRVAGLHALSSQWLGAWLWSWGVAFPTLITIMPLVRRIVSSLVEKPEQ